MSPRHLINEDGNPFEGQELDSLAADLDSLDPTQRKTFRDGNAEAIATNAAGKVLIVAGPGTGKSTLFKRRILFWLEKTPAARILAVSFVRKLVADLAADIQTDGKLSDDQKKQVDVFTLHKFARSIVERNRGTAEWRFAPHFRVIAQDWKSMVWGDVLSISGQKDASFSWKKFEKQLHDDDFEPSADWKKLRQSYFTLCRFYNAAGFSDIILRARDALAENPALNQHELFIFDEYQDFNTAEERLLENMVQAAKGTLTVGDDDQVLYETLKSGKPGLIRAIYKDTTVVNAMLPFCGRCDFHITKAARHFIKRVADADCIGKIYLPMSEAGASPKVQIVGCAAPTTAVDYIRKFIEDNKAAIEQRMKDIVAGAAKDAFLLILSPSRAPDFYKLNGANEELLDLIKPYLQERREFSDDYYKVLNYYSLANYPTNNFTFRKVLHYEKIGQVEVLSLLRTCLAESKPLSALDTETIKSLMGKAASVRDIVDSKDSIDKKLAALEKIIQIEDVAQLKRDLETDAIDKLRIQAIEHQEEEDAELEEIEVKKMSAVELMTIVGSKGLSADNVIIIGFDNVNMGWVTRNAFYVAMTRARKSLHIITALKAGGAASPHDFLNHLPDGNVEFSKYTKGNRTREALDGRRGFIRYLQTLSTQGQRR